VAAKFIVFNADQLIVSGMPPFDGPLSRPQACIGSMGTGYSGKLNYAVHFDGVV
jgi:hypothetical protein